MKLAIPELSLVVLIGASGCGKSTFARKHFKPTEVLSSDFFRGLVSDDEANQAATRDAFDALHFVAGRRLGNARLTVIDATNVQADARKPLLELARRQNCAAAAIVFNLPEEVCQQRDQQRADRVVGPRVINGQWAQLRRIVGGLQAEGFRPVHVLSSPEEVDAAVIER